MAGLTIDAGVLALPPNPTLAGEVERYIENILDWCDLGREPWVEVSASGLSELFRCVEIAPEFRAIEVMLARSGATKCDAPTLLIALNPLLQQQSVEAHFCIEQFEAKKVATHPAILPHGCDAELSPSLERTVAMIAAVRKHKHEKFGDHVLAMKRGTDPKQPKKEMTLGTYSKESDKKTVSVEARITKLEYRSDGEGEKKKMPEKFKGDLPVCYTIRGFIEHVNASKLLQHASENSQVAAAIKVEVYKSRRANGGAPDWGATPPYRIHKDFANNLPRLDESLAKSVLRAIVETLDGSNMRDAHALRTSSAGNAPQRTRARDGATAWRRDIDPDYHLHYWKLKGGIVELASVSYPHDDFEIPE